MASIKASNCQPNPASRLKPEEVSKEDSGEQAQLNEDYVLPKKFSDLNEMTKYLRQIVENGAIPTRFNSVLSESLASNNSLRFALQTADALFYWDSKIEKVSRQWEFGTITSALEKIDRLNNEPGGNNDSAENIKFDIGIDLKILATHDIDDQEKKKEIKIRDNLESVLGKSIDRISSANFIKVQEIASHQCIPELEMSECVKTVLMYVLQKLKMWGCDVLLPANLDSLILKNETTTLETDESNEPEFGNDEETACRPRCKSDTMKLIPLSRIDVISAALSIIDSIDAQDILRVMSFFPIALPLVISDIEQENKFKVLLPWLFGITIKWESSLGGIVENNLFTNPFRIMIAIRLGCNTCGKSTILNQLMADRNMFSSYGEPGADRGPPSTLNGMVEFTWLTQETCGTMLWNSVIQKHYADAGANELLILANLHGDALDHKETIQFINQLATSYIVFIMPDDSSEKMKEKWESFKAIVTGKKIVFLYVDPAKDMKDNSKAVKTAFLNEDSTLEKVRSVIKNAINTASLTVQLKDIVLGESLTMAESCETKESHEFLEFVSTQSCQATKNKMQLQNVHLSRKRNFKMWKENKHLQELVSLFSKVLYLPLQRRRNALAHIEQELSRLFRAESIEPRANIVRLKEEYHRTIAVEDQNSEVLTRIQGQIADAMKRVDSMSLGLEHLFRELGHIYRMAILNSSCEINEGVIHIPKLYADMFINGQAIELLDGDAGEIPGAWFTAIGDQVHRRFPDLKIYVISILGLQSSGKSTLLNALFACKFAVSVGRCTRGLFMRLLFLEKSLSKKLKVDAILLIDSEGLGAPEKVNDDDAEEKDRLLATFAMSVSDLTIINVLGESMQNLTEILQIAIIAMARLEQVQMAADILLVQHLTERNRNLTLNAEEQFCKALQNALKLTKKKDIELGIGSSSSLQNLMKRIHAGGILKQFRPFKNGASAYAPPSKQYHEDVVDLYRKILKRCELHINKVSFKEWYQKIQSYWEAVSHENFAVRFKNIKAVSEFIDRGERIANVKEAVNVTFREHSKELETRIRIGVHESQSQDTSETNVIDKTVHDNLIQSTEDGLNRIPNVCHDPLNGETTPCQHCFKVISLCSQLYLHVEGSDFEHEVKNTIDLHIKNVRQIKLITLTQMLDAEISRQGYSAEFMLEINTSVKKILEERKDGAKDINEEERNEITNEIWKTLIGIASSKVNVQPLNKEIEKALISEYEKTPPFVLQRFNASELPLLHDLFAYKVNKSYLLDGEYKLQNHQVTLLKEMLDDLAKIMLKETRAEHFQSGMIADLKMRVKDALDSVQSKFKIKLESEFKWNCHLYALLKFYKIMEKVQDKWEESYHPVKILESRNLELKKMINTRLQYGFSADSEGRIVAENLLKAVTQAAKKSGDEYRRDYVLGLAWMTNSEHVRLLYFSKLAEEVNTGRFDLALTHFQNPRNEINKWFISEVNKQGDGKELQRFNTTFDAELRWIIREIRDKRTIQDIQKVITMYLSKASNLSFKIEIDIAKMMDADVELFRNSILKILNYDNSVKCYRYGVKFKMPSEDELVMGRLGCTECCFWCGAICWGQRGHHENIDDTRKHHSCHQPGGLKGTHYYGRTLELSVISCHEEDDDQGMRWDDGKSEMPWRDTKLHEKFNSWKYDSHCKNEFNEMMCWFFFKLHKAIATRNSLKPAPEDNVKMTSWQNLDYDKIMSTIKQKIH